MSGGVPEGGLYGWKVEERGERSCPADAAARSTELNECVVRKGIPLWPPLSIRAGVIPP